MSESSDKNGYMFPYTAEEDHLSRTQQAGNLVNDVNNPGYLGSRLSSRHGSRTSSPPSHMSAMQPIAPLTSITDTSE